MFPSRGIFILWISLHSLAVTALAGGDGAQAGSPWLAYLARFHPVLVHFPIALIPAALLAEWLSLKPSWRSLQVAARFCITLGAIASIAAATLGWLAADVTEVPYEPDSILRAHRAAGIATVISGFAAAVFTWRADRTGRRTDFLFYRIALHLSAASAIFAGHFGGLLSYGEQYFSWPTGP